jgi:vanillate O-demethylase ferredoxin subunit
VVRQYSLTGACEDELSYLRGARNRLARRSRYVHETLRPGKLTISARAICFRHQAERVLLLAAGIGITPLYAMALQLKAAGTPFTLHYYVKTAKARRLRANSRSTVSASFILPARAQRWQSISGG